MQPDEYGHARREATTGENRGAGLQGRVVFKDGRWRAGVARAWAWARMARDWRRDDQTGDDAWLRRGTRRDETKQSLKSELPSALV